MHRRQRIEAKSLGNFFEARRLAVMLGVRLQIVENLALSFGERHGTEKPRVALPE
jgi:hypothetical protein